MKTLQFEKGIIGLMDGTGSNLEKVKQYVRVIGTSNPNSNASKLASSWNVPLVSLDINEFEKKRNITKKDFADGKKEAINAREEYCEEFSKLLKEKAPNLPVLAAGFMVIVSEQFTKDFFIINIHPGDLTKEGLTGGSWRPSLKALERGDSELYSVTHIMIGELDAGAVFMKGYPLKIDYSRIEANEKTARAAQNALKKLGDYIVAGATLIDLFAGNWAMDVNELFYCGKKVSSGITIKEHLEKNPDSNYKLTQEEIDKIHEEFYLEAN